MRAVAIPVDDITGVAGFLKEGDRLDILATVEIPMLNASGMEESTLLTLVVLQNIELLAVGTNPETNLKKNSSGANTLTLAVSVQDAQALVLATEQGKIRILLRPPMDHSEVLTRAFQMKDFIP
jgi:pilus assembly protein CpaB